MTFKLEDRQKNTDDAYRLSVKALEYAQRRLKENGITYTCYDPTMTQDENYMAVRIYAEQEAKYVKEYLASHQAKKEVDKPTQYERPDYKSYRTGDF